MMLSNILAISNARCGHPATVRAIGGSEPDAQVACVVIKLVSNRPARVIAGFVPMFHDRLVVLDREPRIIACHDFAVSSENPASVGTAADRVGIEHLADNASPIAARILGGAI